MKKRKSGKTGKEESQFIGFDAPKVVVKELDAIADNELTGRSALLRRFVLKGIEQEKLKTQTT